jgi:hypothetical protein
MKITRHGAPSIGKAALIGRRAEEANRRTFGRSAQGLSASRSIPGWLEYVPSASIRRARSSRVRSANNRAGAVTLARIIHDSIPFSQLRPAHANRLPLLIRIGAQRLTVQRVGVDLPCSSVLLPAGRRDGERDGAE